jgi:hypothetical protein
VWPPCCRVEESRWRCIWRVTGERRPGSTPGGRYTAESLVILPSLGIESLLSESISAVMKSSNQSIREEIKTLRYRIKLLAYG